MVLAIITVGALYHFTSIEGIESAGSASVEGLKKLGQNDESPIHPPTAKSEVKDDPEPQDLRSPKTVLSSKQSEASSTARALDEKATPSPIAKPAADDEDPVNPKATPIENHVLPTEVATPTKNKTSRPDTGPAEPNADGGGGRLEIIAETGIPKIHWSQMPEHFPVPTENLIQIPTGKPKAIPKIQHDFAAETAVEKAAREEKRNMIKKVFTFSWAGYKKKAWMQDELSPVSGKFRNPFCAWGATLVDTLDTLYMMDLEEEFLEAVEAVKEIDFTTSPRNDIPLFETVIRYLGGLVAAYDISNGAHKVLLDKAVELADILMGAFDTPNRMPMTFYLWKPTFASQPHRAKTRVVLAELGSLSVEFTRLAQITKEAKYYDAIARITNEFEDWQNNTRLPGLWPQKVDASGCKKPDVSTQTAHDPATMKPLGIHDSEVVKDPDVTADGNAKKVSHESADKPVVGRNSTESPSASQVAVAVSAHSSAASSTPADASEVINPKGALEKRDVDDPTSNGYHPGTSSKPPECEAQGLASPPFTSSEDFGIGGAADSTYEYLPKEYMLLGGLEEKYRTIYETSADVITEKLLYRTMIPDEKRRILHPGLAKVSDKIEKIDFKPEGSHLGCFAGGMYAVGAKIFGRENDMKIAKELTDGCVWAYEATTTGIMPDGYLAVQCPNPTDCPWNETLWHQHLDPHGHLREQNRLAQQQSLIEADRNKLVGESATSAPPVTSQSNSASEKIDPHGGEAANEKVQTGSSKTEIGVEPQQSADSKLTGSDHPKDESLAEPKEISAQKPAPVPEQSAEHSPSLAAGGAIVEQPVSPPAGAGAASPKSRMKRQLGEIDKSPSTPSSSKDGDSVAAPKADHEPLRNPTAHDSGLSTEHDNLPQTEQPAGTNDAPAPVPETPPYNPPPIPTHEEYVQARIKNERLPKGMTKVTGSKYLLRYKSYTMTV